MPDRHKDAVWELLSSMERIEKSTLLNAACFFFWPEPAGIALSQPKVGQLAKTRKKSRRLPRIVPLERGQGALPRALGDRAQSRGVFRAARAAAVRTAATSGPRALSAALRAATFARHVARKARVQAAWRVDVRLRRRLGASHGSITRARWPWSRFNSGPGVQEKDEHRC